MANTQVQQLAIDRAVQLLRASGASFKVIWNDKEYGDLEVKPVKEPKKMGVRAAVAAAEGRKYGDLKKHYWPSVERMEIGDVVVVPFDTFKPGTLQKAISSGLCAAWGSGSNITSIEGEGIAVLRVK